MSGDQPLILVVDDEAQVRRLLRTVLPLHGFKVLEAESSREGLQLFSGHRPQLVLLDLGLPDGDGLSWVKEIRGWSQTPVIVLSARGREDDKVAALDAGADDYLTKPFGTNELLARVRVALRHATSRASTTEPRVSLGILSVDFEKRRVEVGGEEVHLTPTEYRLLTVLLQHAGKVVTHTQLLREVWGPSHQQHTQYLRVYMGQLRRKLEPDPNRPVLLQTEPGVGYRLRDE